MECQLENATVHYETFGEGRPLLLLHGAEDENTPVYLAGHVYAGLAALGRTASFVRYEGEGHWPGAWSPANQIDYWRRLVAWFEEHL